MLLKIQTAEKAVLEVQGKINNTVRKSELEIFQLAFLDDKRPPQCLVSRDCGGLLLIFACAYKKFISETEYNIYFLKCKQQCIYIFTLQYIYGIIYI